MVGAFGIFVYLSRILDKLHSSIFPVVVQIGIWTNEDEVEGEWLRKKIDLPVIPRIGDQIELLYDSAYVVTAVILGEDCHVVVGCKDIKIPASELDETLAQWKKEGWVTH